MLEVESQDSQESQRNATGFICLCFCTVFCFSPGIAVSGGQGPIFSRLILVVRKKGIAGILGFLSPMMLKEDRTSSPRSCPANFVDDVVMSTCPPSTPSGFRFITRTSTCRK